MDSSHFKQFIAQAQALTVANLKSRYRKTFAGLLWVILNPLIMYGVQVYVFKRILNINLSHYPLFLMGGLLPWIFISQSLDTSTPLFVNSAVLLKSFKINPLVLLTAQIADGAINFFLEVVILLIFCAFKKGIDLSHVLLMPIPFFLLVSFVFSASWALTMINVLFRDTRFLVNFFLAVVFFLTPIFYPVEFVPADLRWIVSINPISYVIEPFRQVLYQFDWHHFTQACSQAALLVALMSVGAVLLWGRLKNEIYFKF